MQGMYGMQTYIEFVRKIGRIRLWSEDNIKVSVKVRRSEVLRWIRLTRDGVSCRGRGLL